MNAVAGLVPEPTAILASAGRDGPVAARMRALRRAPASQGRERVGHPGVTVAEREPHVALVAQMHVDATQPAASPDGARKHANALGILLDGVFALHRNDDIPAARARFGVRRTRGALERGHAAALKNCVRLLCATPVEVAARVPWR